MQSSPPEPAPTPRRRRAGAWNLPRFLLEWKFLKRGRVAHLPLEVSVEVTNSCNFRCAFCPQSDPDHFEIVPRSSLDPERARKILGAVRELGYEKTLLHWTLDGEPFMSKGFADLCVVASELGFTNQYFATNMALTTVERVRALPSDVRYTLTVDYCADSKRFEEHRGTPGSWVKVRDNVRAILADESLGHVRFEVKDMTSYTVTDPEVLRTSMAALRDLFPPGERIELFSKVFHNATGFLARGGSSGRYRLCPYPWSSLNIASNGDVVACCRDLRHKTVVGNVLEDDLARIWNGAAMAALRQDLAAGRPQEQSSCESCDLPWDGSKFTLSYQLQVLRHRLQLGR
ncbi:MAG: radical SAM protein [Planctomycetes bacterium]|jgi:radical SAM protein with 4Fe4S-binding SPASM domain|nr:radical SAM protein [Planctomycetota bacterium]MDP6410633.1 SPASM domain-containing protein [Planctomycetota bacterium]